ncbi:Protein of unknown function [Halobacillus karajensis]|uniref:DUF3231 family protein n=1 Tax=Halobacillus karajensis TaxID=195088 RepID=UPI0008A742D1|nr:DUF3231 family protein [Halobacillus karajensis]SEH98509.1 Protein of unknown function [Halobacillus karajensis]
MMSGNQWTALTAAELSNLWTSYQNDSMAICGIKFYLSHVKDEEIKQVLEYALQISEEHISKVRDFLKQEHCAIPLGFTDADVNMEAPRLFSDRFYLEYISNMGKFGLTAYSLALSISDRSDMIGFYSDCLDETKKLHNMAKEVGKKKGVLIRTPEIPKTEKVNFVKKQSFLAGWFGDKRPLLGVEVANLVYNAKRNALGAATIIGFAQVAENKAVQRYFERGLELANKHFDKFQSVLREEDLHPGALNLASEVTSSTEPPFSDKLMMYHITALIGSGIGQYGVAMASGPRHDLSLLYGRLIVELSRYAEDGAKIMIEHGWMESPPSAADRHKLFQE